MSATTTTQFSTGPWTDEEHQNFLRGVEEHGRGNWNAIGALVRTRNPQQTEAYAGQHFAQSAEEQNLEPAKATTIISVAADGGGDGGAALPGVCYFGNGDVLYDWTGVL